MRERHLSWSIAMSVMALLVILCISAGSGNGANAASVPPSNEGAGPLSQQFQDVPDSNPFAHFINALKADNIVAGYPCGGANEPCVPPGNLPYYRPTVDVNRQQMAKFVDLGRRNIADATGSSLALTNPLHPALTVSSAASDSVDVANSLGNDAVQATCTRTNQNCWAFHGVASAGNVSAHFEGGRGAFAGSADASYSGLEVASSGSNSYGIKASSDQYRAGFAESGNSNFYSFEVAAHDGVTQSVAALGVVGGARIEGTLYALGGCTGCVISEIVQNVGSEPLETGDVVAIVGTSEAVAGDTPVVTVRKADGAYQAGVFGIIDKPLYVPDAATRQAYQSQEEALKEALDQRSALERSAAPGTKADLSRVQMPDVTISDLQGTIHEDMGASGVAVGSYGSVVTQGVYKTLKVDAGFGPIHAGDLLVASPHAGYAMKASDKSQAQGAVLGKALGDLESGTGTLSVMVTLK